jgi:hypothetical protein
MRITLEQCCRKDGRPHWHKRQVGLCQKCLMPFGWMRRRYRPRFFDQVGHQIMSAYIKQKHFFTKSCHRQTYQNYEQPPQSLQNL